MARVVVSKVVSSLPGTLTPNTVYAVRVGAGFSLFISDMTGATAHALNGDPDPTYTKAAFESLAAASGLVANKSYVITDDGTRIALAMSTSTYVYLARTNELTAGGTNSGIAPENLIGFDAVSWRGPVFFPWNSTITHWSAANKSDIVGVPVEPTLVSPVGGGGASGLNFTVSGYSHPSSVAMDCVLIETATDISFTASVQRSSVVSGGLTVGMAARTTGTTVYWRAKFIDRLGGESAWSSTGSFVVVVVAEYIGYAVGGNDNSAAITKSITNSIAGDLLLLAIAFNGSVPATPAGWTLRQNYTDDPLSGSNMAIFSTVATTANQSVSIAAFSVSMAAIRGITDYVSLDRNTIPGSTLNASITISPTSVGVPCIALGFDRNGSVNTFPAAYSPFFGNNAGGAYFSQLFGFSIAATGGTWTRTSNASYKAHVALIRLQ